MIRDAARPINILSNLLKRKIDGFSSIEGMSLTQNRVLLFLLRNSDKAIYQRDIENEYSIRPATATNLLNSLEAMGLLYRETSESDSRRKRIILRDEALKHKASAEKDIENLEALLTEGISAEELEVFRSVTDRMIENLQAPPRR